ncbi:MAG: outer membrane protein insertion porin family, partial [Abditibacteriota bacterium]|nr:outer membrane protein insertion porin family [Abditibacteriota bacterium]
QAEGREIVNIRVVGNRVVPEQSILLKATTRRGAAFSARQLDLDRAAIDSLGFFASVQYQVTPNLEDPNKIDLTFIVIEHSVVTGFRFEGNTTVKTEDLIKILETKPGTVLNNNTINSDVTKIQTLYRERGYAALVTNVQRSVDNTGTVVFTIQEAKITKLVIAGLKKTKESLVRTQIRTKPGDPFDQFKVRRDLNRIYDLGFFEDVTYKVDDDPEAPGSLIVTLQLKEKRTGQFTVGLGFDSRSKVTGFFTLAENNLRGNGQRAFASVEAGGQRTFDVGFGDPFVGSRNSSYDISVFDRRIFREPRAVTRVIGQPTGPQTLYYEEQRTGGRLNYTIPLDEDRNSSVLFGYRNERARLFQTDNSGINIPVTLPVNSAGRVSAFSTGFLRDARDLRLDPSRGSREQLLVERAFSLLGGDQAFTKIDLDYRRYIPLIGPAKVGELPRAVFAARFVAGKSFGALPAFEQYFIGGSDTVRGYDVDEQLGDNQFYTNLELRYRFQRKFQIVGFLDVGKATGGRFATADEMLVGFGGGIRLQTPIGPIRLDIGHGRDGVRTHFAIGPTF